MVAYTASATGQPYPLEFTTDERQWEVPLPHAVIVRGAEIYTASGVAGFGLIQVPRYRVEHQIAAGQLLSLMEDFPPPPMEVSVLYPQSRHLSLRIRVFIDWLTELFRSAQAHLG
jgi:DNA-binding transcriptional LysR family regulator